MGCKGYFLKPLIFIFICLFISSCNSRAFAEYDDEIEFEPYDRYSIGIAIDLLSYDGTDRGLGMLSVSGAYKPVKPLAIKGRVGTSGESGSFYAGRASYDIYKIQSLFKDGGLDAAVFGELGSVWRPEFGYLGFQAIGFEFTRPVRIFSDFQQSFYIDYLFISGGNGLGIGIVASYMFGK